MRIETQKLHSRLRDKDKAFDESFSTKSWTRLGRVALEALGIVDVEGPTGASQDSAPAIPEISALAATPASNHDGGQGQDGAEIEDVDVCYHSTGEMRHAPRVSKPQIYITV